MNLSWKEHKAENSDKTAANNSLQIIHLASINENSDQVVKSAIEESIEKSVALLAENISDQSRYMLFEWNTETSALTIVVSDDHKAQDAKHAVKCCFNLLTEKIKGEVEVNDYAMQIQYWIRDYLTTSASFMSYSLVAAFHLGDRKACSLL